MELLSRSKVKLMTVRQPRYSKEEFAQRGDALYEAQIRLPPVGYANASRRRQSWQDCGD
jgi:hypothetical protein